MKQIIYDCIDAIVAELQQPDTREKINTDLIQPLIHYLTKQIYPYIISTCVIILLIFVCVISILIILIQGLIKKSA